MANNPEKLNVPWLSKKDIEQKVKEFCAQYNIDQTNVPLDVEIIVQSDLHIELRPEKGVYKLTEVDALLLSTRKTMIIDLDRFMKESFQNRLRFTIAHEIGHFIMHEKVHEGVQFSTVEEWAEFMLAIPDIDYHRLEWQCDEFAGRLLIEGGLLRKKFEESKAKLKGTHWENEHPLPKYVVEAMATEIGKFFGVSPTPIMIRLESEGIWNQT